MSYALVALALAILVIGNPATIRTAAILADITVPGERPPVRWLAAQSDLQPWFEKADVIVTQAELEMLYYYDRYDILLSASRLGEIPDGIDFDPDFRTGRPVIGTLEAMQKVRACYSPGIFVTNERRWRDPDLIAPAIADFIALNTRPLELPRESNVIAFAWDEHHALEYDQLCDQLPANRKGTG